MSPRILELVREYRDATAAERAARLEVEGQAAAGEARQALRLQHLLVEAQLRRRVASHALAARTLREAELDGLLTEDSP